MSRLLSSAAHTALVAVLVSYLPAPSVHAADIVVNSGDTNTTAQTLKNQDTLTIQGGGTLDVSATAIKLKDASAAPGIVIDNFGTIKSGNRGIDTSGSSTIRTFTFNNETGATVDTFDDGIRIDTDVTDGKVTINNAGTITSQTGQAIDLDSISTNGATINNYATGVISTQDADAIRAGGNGTVNNWGKIISNAAAPDDSKDGIDFQDHAGTVNNYAGGVISGARHGITSDVDVNVYNEAGASITGRNGSGVGSDGNGTVLNYGTITGTIDDVSENGDGDGVDIDFKANITNYGTIQGTGSKGEKDGSPNTSEGIAAGGGTIINGSANAVISGKDNAILIDDSNAGAAPYATQITNLGTIRGENGFGIRIIGTQNDTIQNAGLIEGANGQAVDLGGGDDTLIVNTGGKFIGLVDGGAGTDTVDLDGTGTFAGGVNFEILDVKGDWTLTGTQSYSNGATLESGKLSVDGTLDADLTTKAGTILAGNGTIGSASIFGTIAPGHSIGTLTFTGDYQQQAGSTYEVELDSTGKSDLITVDGAATLAGSVVVKPASGQYKLGTQYTILTAQNGITGGYTSATDSMPFIDFALASDANNIYLDITRSNVTFQSVAITSNQHKVAAAIDSLGATSAVLNSVANATSEEAARRAFNSLSGEIYASANGIMLEDSRFLRDAVMDRVRNDLEDKPRGGLWGQAFGSQGTYSGDSNAAGVDRTIGGVFVGVDTKAGSFGSIGIAAGYSHASLDDDGRNSSQERDDAHLALYGGGRWGALGVRWGAGYTWADLDTKRRFDLGGTTDEARSNQTAGTAQVFGELGYHIGLGGVDFEPFAGIAYVNLNTDDFREAGSDAALKGFGDNQDLPTTTLGLRAATNVIMQSGTILTTHGMVGWRHALDDVDTSQVLAFSGGTPFSIDGVPIARDTLMLGAGLDVNFSPDLTVGLSYSGEIGDDIQDHGVKGNLSWKF
ncbi:autotransporter domain-containing protein [Hyphomicrobium sp. 802]|uniref:autotransporter outer membrane beta-barrel domain-containing protein n=1 Tax=Hyphomicrobium sp. 802 TaxID=1112272 RepID=UPI00045E8F49|nr:autotransporter domain-containing protein [Hyphomicrobium sp. 802]